MTKSIEGLFSPNLLIAITVAIMLLSVPVFLYLSKENKSTTKHFFSGVFLICISMIIFYILTIMNESFDFFSTSDKFTIEDTVKESYKFTSNALMYFAPIIFLAFGVNIISDVISRKFKPNE